MRRAFGLVASIGAVIALLPAPAHATTCEVLRDPVDGALCLVFTDPVVQAACAKVKAC